MNIMIINNFLIIKCIGEDDKLGLRINKDFFIQKIKKKNNDYNLVSEIFDLFRLRNVIIDENFSVIVNLGPGSFSGIRTSLSVAKGLLISKKIKLYGYKDTDLTRFDKENIENLLNKNLIEKKLIKAIYLS